MPVDTASDTYEAFVTKWQRARDCYEGSDAVKKQGAGYLPPLASHGREPAKYEAYKQRALFYNATGRTVDGLAGLIFQKEPTLLLPASIQDHDRDVTLGGESAETFALQVTREVLLTGRYGILVEMGSEQVAGKRPYWCGYRAEDIVSWRTQRLGGDEITTRVVLREVAREPDERDEFVTRQIDQYRVLRLRDGAYTQTVYRKASKSSKYEPWTPPGQQEPEVVAIRRGEALPFIPFVFVSPNSTSARVDKPPLLDLVDVNLSHYRTMADLAGC